MMRVLVAAVAAGAVWLALVSGVSAGPPASGTTALVGPALEDSPVDVVVTVSSSSPIVPYGFSIVNKCWLDGEAKGHFDSFEEFAIVGPWYDIGGTATTTVTVNLQEIPAGALCRVAVYQGNTLVKGSLTEYEVNAAP